MEVESMFSKHPHPSHSRLRESAVELEGAFIAEMLKHVKLGQTPDEFGGGAGEDQFGSFLRFEQARQMAAAGGIGLAEAIFDALRERAGE